MATITINNTGGCYDTAKRYENSDGQEHRLKRVRVRDHHRRDFDLYLRFGEMLKRYPVKTINDEVGYTPIQCYVLMDSHGDREGPYPCVDYDTLDKVRCGKENMNLQISMWVETCMENPLLLMPYEVKEITKNYPDWVFKSYINRLSKEWKNKHGWVPKFIGEFLV